MDQLGIMWAGAQQRPRTHLSAEAGLVERKQRAFFCIAVYQQLRLVAKDLDGNGRHTAARRRGRLHEQV